MPGTTSVFLSSCADCLGLSEKHIGAVWLEVAQDMHVLRLENFWQPWLLSGVRVAGDIRDSIKDPKPWRELSWSVEEFLDVQK